MRLTIRRACSSAVLAQLLLACFACDPVSAQSGESGAVSEAPPPGAPGYRELAFAFARLARGDLEGALKYALRARELAPDYETPTRVLAEALAKSGRPAEALAVANAYAASHKPSGALLAQRGYLRKKLNDASGAEADLLNARRLGGLTKQQDAAAAAALFDLAMGTAYEALNAGRLHDAIKTAERARTIDPTDEAPVQVLVEAYGRLGLKARALSEAAVYTSQNKASGRLLAQRAYLRRAMEDAKGAEADFEAALATRELEEKQAQSLRGALAEAKKAVAESVVQSDLEQGRKSIAAGDFARAEKAARGARAKAPTAEAPVLLLMAALNGSRRPRAAADEADRFINDNQPSAVLLAQRGYMRRAAGDLDAAIADFKAVVNQPGLEPALEKRARLALQEAERARLSGGAPTASPFAQALNRAYDALKAGRTATAVHAAREAQSLDPKAEESTLVLVNALTRQGRRAEAVSEANRYLSVYPRNAEVLAQRGFLRRDTKDFNGAITDFSQAVKLGTLPARQVATLAGALSEARYFAVADKAFKASAARDWPAALRYARAAQAFRRAEEGIFRVTIEALARLGRMDEALQASNALIARGKAGGQAYGQRGYLRESMGDHAGAAADFRVALEKKGLPAAPRVMVERGLAVARASIYESQLEPAQAQAELADFTRSHPRDAAGWSALGQLYVRGEKHAEAVAAFENGLAIERRGEDLLAAGYASVHVDRSKESRFFREAIDHWSADPSLSERPARDRELVRTQIVEADASVRTNVVFGGFTERPKRWGGYQAQPSFETLVRFDGRHLPYVFGLEAFVGGFWSQDQTRYTESFSRVGLRLRPIDGVNFSVSGEWQRHFAGGPHDQFALSWAYGYGGFAYASAPSAGAGNALQPATMSYPYQSGWRPLTSFAAYGSYRTGERRYIQNAVGLLGYSYWDALSRTVIGPAAMVTAGVDTADAKPIAFGVGPAMVFRAWLGGDYYRAYNSVITLQLGYLFPFGESRRQGGLNATINFTF